MIDYARLLVGDSHRCSFLAAAGSDPVIKSLQIGAFGAGGSPGSLNKDTLEPAVPFAGMPALPLAGTLVVAGTQPRPESRVPLRGEEPNISPYLHKDMLSRNGVKARGGSDKINLMLIGLYLFVNTLLELGDSLLQIPEVLQMHAEKEAMMLIYPSLQSVHTRKRISRTCFLYLRTLDEFDFSAITSLNKAKVLELSRGEYIRAKENVIAIGNTGTGKTHLAISLGLLACQQGWKVMFYTACGIINELSEARSQQRLGRLQKQLQSYELIILDEVGFIPFTPSGY